MKNAVLRDSCHRLLFFRACGCSDVFCRDVGVLVRAWEVRVRIWGVSVGSSGLRFGKFELKFAVSILLAVAGIIVAPMRHNTVHFTVYRITVSHMLQASLGGF